MSLRVCECAGLRVREFAGLRVNSPLATCHSPLLFLWNSPKIASAKCHDFLWQTVAHKDYKNLADFCNLVSKARAFKLTSPQAVGWVYGGNVSHYA